MIQRRVRLLNMQIGLLFLLFFCLSTPVYATPSHVKSSPISADFPTVDPFYIYDQLAYLATHFQHREAGYDNHLPPGVNGHDEFASYWSQEMLHNFQNFGAHIRYDSFPVKGWRNRPAPLPAFNVELTIPGASQPDQIVVIGCHYDGEAVSTQSAYDDTSGCAIELGVARALSYYWQSHHLYPARTLRFLLFDAEEQGLYGSYHYVNETSNGDLQNIVAMFNEEQNGMAFPVRYLGQASNPQLPFFIDMTPLQHSTLSGPLLARSQQFRSLMQQAVPAVFAQFRTLGFLGLTYHNTDKKPVTQAIFTPEQTNMVHIEDDQLGSSDQVPFTQAGLPCATFVGNSSYYDTNPPPGSYPYDQSADTLELLNTYAQGGPTRSYALSLALALPGMFTTWMLHQSAILGEVAATTVQNTGPLFALSSLGQTQVGQTVQMDASTTFDPQDAHSSFSSIWNFGDGTTATGLKVSHTYKEAKHYTLTLQVRSSSGTRQLSQSIVVVTQAPVYKNDYTTYQPSGSPEPNAQVLYPTPDSTQADTLVGPAATANAVAPAPKSGLIHKALPSSTNHPFPLLWLLGLVLIVFLLGALALLISRWLR